MKYVFSWVHYTCKCVWIPADFHGEVDKPLERTDSQETPPTPLFDEDVSQPLEAFPRIDYEGPGWEMQLRQPNKKKITGQRCVRVLLDWIGRSCLVNKCAISILNGSKGRIFNKTCSSIAVQTRTVYV